MEAYCHTERKEWTIIDNEYNIVLPVYEYLLEEKAKEKRPNSIKAYCYDLLWFYRFLDNRVIEPSELQVKHIEEFRDWVLADEDIRDSKELYFNAKSRIEPSTWKRLIGTVYAYLDWLRVARDIPLKIDTQSKYQEKNINGKKIRFNKSFKSRWEIKELKRSIEYIPLEKRILIRSFLMERDQLIFDFLYLSGLRLGEAFSFKVDSFPPRNEKDSIYPLFLKGSDSEDLDKQTKTGQRTVAIPKELYKRIAQYITFKRYGSKSEYVFVTTKNASGSKKGDALSPATFRKNLKRACKKAGVKYTPHDLRHTLATDMLEATGDILEVQRILGHASVTTTEKYTHAPQDKVARVAADALNSLYSELMVKR